MPLLTDTLLPSTEDADVELLKKRTGAEDSLVRTTLKECGGEVLLAEGCLRFNGVLVGRRGAPNVAA